MIEEKLPEESYLCQIPAIRKLEQEEFFFEKKVTFLIGENGSGKSTLLEAIAVAMGFNPEGGTKNFSFSFRDTHSDLHKYLRVSRNDYPKDGFFLRVESFYNFASMVDDLDGGGSRPLIDSYGGVSLHQQSHGESFMALIRNRFAGNGLYLLDEPEAALSPSKLMELLIHIHELSKRNSQFIISTHSPILMSYPGCDLFELNGEGIRKVNYHETDHYRITKEFIENADRMYHHLFGDEEGESS